SDLGPDAAAREEAQAVADAAHVQAVRFQRREALADDALGAATADVDHQPAAGVVGQVVRHAQVDETRLLATRDDLDLVPERALGLLQERPQVTRLTEGVGADRAHAFRRDAAQPLAETLQALQR